MPGQSFSLEIIPALPPDLSRLADLAGNLWYSWHRPARELFMHLDAPLWDSVGHNPKLFLRRISQTRLTQAATDQVFLESYRKLLSSYDAYHDSAARHEGAARLADDALIAYFCAEYGFHESLPIYSGGLGILASHHCKTASDLRLPLVAVGLLYSSGYFSQQIDETGNQIAQYVETNFDHLPIAPVLDGAGAPVVITLEFPTGPVSAKIWEVHAGHVRLLLLDTNCEENTPENRKITHQLYGGDRETRIKQEFVLGAGGAKALQATGLSPSIWHMNEGHPAFLILERIKTYVNEGTDFDAALEMVAASTVFTTHTPVPAGHDYFPEDMVLPYLRSLYHDLDAQEETLLSLGRSHNGASEFNMTTLAIRGSRHHNGVSRIHGSVSQELCAGCWPEIPPEENPMDFITNGVHVPTVLAPEWNELFDRFLGPSWRTRLCDVAFWQGVHDIPDHLFWSVRQSIKSRTLRTLRVYLTRQHLRNQMSEPHLERALKSLHPDDPNTLTIGFARRFATYKRATLLFNDLDWLRALVSDTSKPVIFVFCGKAHPADQPAQALIKTIHEISNRPEFVGNVLLVEGYDLGLARRLFAGVDVWLNNPVYALEASGTSGMKAACNGTINLSVTDGWWAEGFDNTNGWAIRPSPHQDDAQRRDAEDARTLYELLQDQVIPLYYQRDHHGYSESWVTMAKRSISGILPRFNMTRVVNEYVDKLYLPAITKSGDLLAEPPAAAALAAWKRKVRNAWSGVSLRRLDSPPRSLPFGEHLVISVAVRLNGLSPDDVAVEAVLEHPRLSDDHIARGNAPDAAFTSEASTDNGKDTRRRKLVHIEPLADTAEALYRIELGLEWSGRVEYRIRVFPCHHHLSHPFETGLMRWL